ncbi:MAG: hypothetical protein ACI4PQ_00620 [Butyricicoccaceae bacterium]
MGLAETLKATKSLGIIYEKGKIPLKKLKNAKGEYGGFQPENVLFLTDGTVFGSAKKGIVITKEGIHGNYYGGAFHISFVAVASLRMSGTEYVEAVDPNGNAKQLIHIGVGEMAPELVRVYKVAREELYRQNAFAAFDNALQDFVGDHGGNGTQPDYEETIPDRGETVPENGNTVPDYARTIAEDDFYGQPDFEDRRTEPAHDLDSLLTARKEDCKPGDEPDPVRWDEPNGADAVPEEDAVLLHALEEELRRCNYRIV